MYNYYLYHVLVSLIMCFDWLSFFKPMALIMIHIFGHRRRATCLKVFNRDTQKPTCSADKLPRILQFRLDDNFHLRNNKGTDQTSRMSRLACVFVVHKL